MSLSHINTIAPTIRASLDTARFTAGSAFANFAGIDSLAYSQSSLADFVPGQIQRLQQTYDTLPRGHSEKATIAHQISSYTQENQDLLRVVQQRISTHPDRAQLIRPDTGANIGQVQNVLGQLKGFINHPELTAEDCIQTSEKFVSLGLAFNQFMDGLNGPEQEAFGDQCAALQLEYAHLLLELMPRFKEAKLERDIVPIVDNGIALIKTLLTDLEATPQQVDQSLQEIAQLIDLLDNIKTEAAATSGAELTPRFTEVLNAKIEELTHLQEQAQFVLKSLGGNPDASSQTSFVDGEYYPDSEDEVWSPRPNSPALADALPAPLHPLDAMLAALKNGRFDVVKQQYSQLDEEAQQNLQSKISAQFGVPYTEKDTLAILFGKKLANRTSLLSQAISNAR